MRITIPEVTDARSESKIYQNVFLKTKFSWLFLG